MRVYFVPALLLVSAALLGASPKEARRLFLEGQKAEKAGQLARAYLLYTQSVAQDPYNPEYWFHSQALRVPATLLPGEAGSAEKSKETPAPPSQLPEALPPAELKASPVRKDVDLRGDAKALFTEVARMYQLEAIFDSDYQPGAPLRFRLGEAGYQDALHGLETATGSFVVPKSERLILVVKDTPQKRNDLEPFMSVTVPVPQALTTQDAQDLMRNVQQAVGMSTGVALDAQHGVIVIRERVSRVRPAQALIEQLLRHRAMVSVEVEFVEQSRSRSLQYGVSPQTLFSLVDFGSLWHSKPTIPSGLANFAVFGGGKTFLGLGITSAQAFATMSSSGGNVLFRTEIRSIDGLQASVHVGDKYPVATSRYLSSNASDQFSVPPAITFQDLGLLIEITPRVSGEDEVTLKLNAEFKSLTGQVVDEIPVMSSRKLQSDVRLRSGEWAVIAGLLNSSQARTVSGLAGFSRIPLAGPLFSQRGRDEADDEVLIVLKPTLLSLPPSGSASELISLGSDQRPRAPL